MRTKSCLTATDVKAMLAACEAESTKSKLSMAISIVDEGGHLLGFLRMDGASVIAADTSLAKARTSAISGMPTKFLEDMVQKRPAMAGGSSGLLPVQGGMPIRWENQCVGGIGVGGAPSEEDERIALAGIAALG